MPKYRQLHTKTIDSFDFNEMPDDFTRVVWLLLTLILDSEGRGIDNPSWIKSKMFPLRIDIENQQIEEVFNWFSKRKMIVRYSKDKHNYFYIPTFKLYQSGTQKESPSILPAPDKLQTYSGVSKEEVRTAESASESASESESESESGESHAPASAPDKLSVSPIQAMLEKITGLPPSGINDIKAMDEIEKMNPTQEDIQAAYDWLVGQGKTIRYYSSLTECVRTAIAKRLQPVRKPTSQHEKNVEILRQEMELAIEEDAKNGEL